MSSWIDSVKELGVLAVAEAAGLDVCRNSVSPCPACGAERRGSDDPRGPVGVRPDNEGWVCHRCRVAGDGPALAAWVVVGEPLVRENFRAVREACESWGLCPRGLAERRERREGGFAPSPIPPFLPVASEPVPSARSLPSVPFLPCLRPPHEEVDTLWATAQGVTGDEEVVAWLRFRGLNPGTVEDRNLARALPATGWLPEWARSSAGTWRQSGHRVIFRLWNDRGEPVSMRARAVAANAKPAKALAPLGTSVTGTVLADPLAVLMFSGLPLGDGKPAAAFVTRCGLVMAEGEPDWLSWATRWAESHDDAPAVVGLVAGSWTRELAGRVPNGTRIAVRTHADETGETYAKQVIETLGGRCAMWRVEARP